MDESMSPGTYLRKRREAAGIEIEDLALALETIPPVSHRVRCEMLVQVERDLHPIGLELLGWLARAGVHFDLDVLLTLADRFYFHTDLPVPPICRTCGCSQADACVSDCGEPCGWAAPDLCTRCAEPDDRTEDEAPVDGPVDGGVGEILRYEIGTLNPGQAVSTPFQLADRPA